MIQTFDHGAVRELRLNRPPVKALSPELIAAFLEAIQAAPRDGKRALVISGSPGMFSAGLDVPLLLKLDRPLGTLPPVGLCSRSSACALKYAC
jgi:Delta3-Delta2-enoyl-CoA isomerase